MGNVIGFLVGGSIGAAVWVFFVCYLVFKFGPPKWGTNFAIQVVLTGLMTWYLASDHYGTHHAPIDVATEWLGWIIGVVIALFVTRKRRRDVVAPPVDPAP